MSHCIVPNWNSRHHQRQDHQEIQLGEERNSNRSNQSHQNLSTTYVGPMSNNYEVGSEDQVTWEISREQPAAVALMHGHGGMIGTGLPLPPQTKPHTWSRTGDTLESIVHQATFSNTNTTTSQQHVPDCNREQEVKHYSTSIMPTSSFGKWRENMISTTTTPPPSQQMQSMSYSCGGLRINNSMGTEVDNRVEKCGGSGLDMVSKKRVIRCGKNSDEAEERTSCAGADASENNTITMMNSWNSFDQSSLSPTFKTPATINTHHHSHSQHCWENQDEEFENKGESLRSQSSTRRSRAAVVHNQSERRRRDRINEKMKDLQKLVPNASKTDKASMLDEVIEYLKQLQAQVHMLSSARTIPQMVMPFGMQQQLQMSILGRMGMGMGVGMGMGMFDVNMNFPRNIPQSLPPLLHGAPPPPIGNTTAAPSFVPPPFTMPSLVPPLISSTTPLKPPNMDSTNINNTNTNPIPNFNDAYGTFLAQQSVNMDFFNKMAALYRQQANQPSKKPSLYSRPNNVQGDR